MVINRYCLYVFNRSTLPKKGEITMYTQDYDLTRIPLISCGNLALVRWFRDGLGNVWLIFED